MKNREITTKQDIFTDALLNGCGIPEAARLADFSYDYARKLAMDIVKHPKLRGHARDIIKGKIDIEAAPEAYRLLLSMMRSKTTRDTLRVDIAKFMLNHSLPTLKAVDSEGQTEKDPSEMTDEELREYIRRSDDVLVQRGKLIDITPKQRIDDII